MKAYRLIIMVSLAIGSGSCLQGFPENSGVDWRALLLLPGSGGSSSSGSTVTIANAQNNGLVDSGFIVGTVSPVADVEAAVDGGSFSSATVSSSGAWSYALPAGTSGWSQGSKHTFEVRAVNNTGGAVSISIYRGLNRDINGDGYAEFAVSATEYATSTGRVYLFYGDPGTTPTSRAPVKISGETVSHQFGDDIAMGDLNGDGYAELIVGADSYGGSNGRVYIWDGSSTQIPDGSTGTNASRRIDGTAGGFGSGLGVGDLNDDGYDDLAVGSPTRTSSNGDVRLWYGSAAGITDGTGDGTADQTFTTTGTGNLLGDAILIDDLSGDGVADLIMAEYNWTNNGTGRVHAFLGVSGSGVTGGVVTTASTTVQGATTNTSTGRAIALGDVNGDAVADLIIGAPESSTSTGAVYVFHGGASFFGQGTIMATTAQWSTTGEATGDELGRDVAACDVDGDGIDELLMGARGNSTSAGRVYVFPGETGFSGTHAVSSAGTIVSGASTNDQFGSELILMDWNSDGYCDPGVGALGYNAGANNGALYFYSGPNGTAEGLFAGETGGDQLGEHGF